MISQLQHGKVRLLCLLLVGLMALVGLQSTSTQRAEAVPPTFNGGWTQPLDSMSGLSSGFLANNCGHAGYGSYINDQYGNPLYHIANDYGKAAGTAVYSIGSGVVLQTQAEWPGDAVFIRYTAADGTEFLAVYGHINRWVNNGNTVRAGEQIGTVYDDGGNSHLHFGIRASTSVAYNHNGSMPCTSWADGNGYVDPLPYLSAHPVVSSPPSQTVTERVVMRQGAVLQGKDGLNDNWTGLTATASTKFKAAGNRVGFIDANAVLWAKDGLNGNWFALNSGVDDFVLTPTRVVMRQGSVLKGKDGLNDNWTVLTSEAGTTFLAAGNRVGFMTAAGVLKVKEGLNGSWLTLATVDDFRLTAGRVIVRQGSTLLAKDGLNDNWMTMTLVASSRFEVAGDRIGFLDSYGVLRVKEGLNGNWLTLATVDDFRLTAGRVTIRQGTVLQAKDGLNDNWAWLTDGAASNFVAAGSRIGFMDVYGVLRVKEGLNGNWLTLATVDDFVLS